MNSRTEHKYAQIWRTVCLVGDEAEPEIEMAKCRMNYVRIQTVHVAVSVLNFDILCLFSSQIIYLFILAC